MSYVYTISGLFTTCKCTCSRDTVHKCWAEYREIGEGAMKCPFRQKCLTGSTKAQWRRWTGYVNRDLQCRRCHQCETGILRLVQKMRDIADGMDRLNLQPNLKTRSPNNVNGQCQLNFLSLIRHLVTESVLVMLFSRVNAYTCGLWFSEACPVMFRANGSTWPAPWPMPLVQLVKLYELCLFSVPQTRQWHASSILPIVVRTCFSLGVGRSI